MNPSRRWPLLAWTGLVAVLGVVGEASAASRYEPVLDPEAGVLGLNIAFAGSRLLEEDLECGEGENCSAAWNRSLVTAEAQVVPLKGVAVFGEIATNNERIAEANYRGTGLYWGGGLRLSVPIPDSDWSLAAQGSMSWAWGEGSEVDTGGKEASWAHVHDVSAMAAWGGPVEGLTAWVGAETAWHWRHQLQPLGYADNSPVLDIRMVPAAPASIITGASVTSQDMGPSWNRSARLTTGVAFSYGQRTGFSAWVGARY